ncbi:hypothetical protein HMPREF9010_02120 [Bacteroides sp. 3_1_23]|nr:hypothetical protein HMPREF9010_02120 [Bacteroides sp. 3_1_23]
MKPFRDNLFEKFIFAYLFGSHIQTDILLRLFFRCDIRKRNITSISTFNLKGSLSAGQKGSI